MQRDPFLSSCTAYSLKTFSFCWICQFSEVSRNFATLCRVIFALSLLIFCKPDIGGLGATGVQDHAPTGPKYAKKRCFSGALVNCKLHYLPCIGKIRLFAVSCTKRHLATTRRSNPDPLGSLSCTLSDKISRIAWFTSESAFADRCSRLYIIYVDG